MITVCTVCRYVVGGSLHLQFREYAVEGSACTAADGEDHPEWLPAQGVCEARHAGALVARLGGNCWLTTSMAWTRLLLRLARPKRHLQCYLLLFSSESMVVESRRGRSDVPRLTPRRDERMGRENGLMASSLHNRID